MIPYNSITAWGTDHPWPTREQVEQDLLLTQGICAIAEDPLLREELVIRGGTAFHKLYLPKPLRYSEDLDYVRTKTGGIADITRALTAIGENLGFSVRTKIVKYPKVFWKTTSQTGDPIKIKIEINTFERSPALELTSKTLDVENLYFSTKASIPTFQAEELVATKLRALYQRSKGRDLFDIWLALTVLNLDKNTIIDALEPYRPEGLTGRQMELNLRVKLKDSMFLSDINNLVVGEIAGYSPIEAAELVIKELFAGL
jgi:predicted nucleotidyltransferase component of viral defense system